MITDDFSLMRGGPTYRAVHAVGRWLPGVRLSWLLAAVLCTIAFVPLAVLSWRDGTLLPGSVAMPLLADWFLIFRFLLALPLLVLAAAGADARLRAAMRQFGRSGLVPARVRPRFERILQGARRARDSWFPELACLLLAILPVIGRPLAPELVGAAYGASGDWQFAGGGHTAAGLWAEQVAAPLFRFVLLLWLWRFVLWSWLLWRFSRIHLALCAAHPDQAGGLAFLGQAQTRFVFLAAACGLVVSGYCINLLLYSGETLFGLRYLIVGYAAGATLALLAPLLPMAAPLARAKRHALFKYGLLGQRVARDFDRLWRRGGSESMLDSPSPSALADYGGGPYANVAAMHLVPVTRRNLLSLAFAATAPFVPMFFFAMSMDELAKRLFSILM
ncbi:hypothetical protein [Pseudoxanthomonas suwonensis]|uniref:Transmembrane protein n=1 Tax=Pseudoxanthomonas suwonensis TaxID=314722 RepID=A0A0E3Z073_9GAMM|nr:hypothetical protein [Pseudoxanthomonas suwonensis]AKC85879.1 hypothetical protein WQ53_02965 [Pseudoxanthomonas suwonensis]